MTNAHKLLLSKIPKLFRIEPASGKRSVQVKWIDFDLSDFESDYPQVNQFLFQPDPTAHPDFIRQEFGFEAGTSLLALPWDEVKEVDWAQSLIRVARLKVIRAFDDEAAVKGVLLGRDILDAYVIDLRNRRLTRANDLLLEEGKGLRLVAADTGMRALARRLSGGLYQGFSESDLQDWKYVEFLRGDTRAVQAGAIYHRRIERLPPGEIASLADALPYLHAAELISLLPHQLAADTMELMSPERQLQAFEELDEARALRTLEKMAPDIAADLIGRLSADQAREYLDQLPKPCSELIVDLLRYPENTVGSIMTNDVISVPGELTVAEARQRLRKKLQAPDFVYFIYVVDSDRDQYLKGVITLRSILVAKDNQRLEAIMNPDLETLDPLDSPRQAAYKLIKSQLAALPVVARDGRLLGVVTVDAAVSLVAPGAWGQQAPRIFS